jgi:hypothetical protein
MYEVLTAMLHHNEVIVILQIIALSLVSESELCLIYSEFKKCLGVEYSTPVNFLEIINLVSRMVRRYLRIIHCPEESGIRRSLISCICTLAFSSCNVYFESDSGVVSIFYY